MDPKINDSIQEAVSEIGQSEALARRIISWFKAIASENEDINDKQVTDRHLELLYDEAEISEEKNSFDNDCDRVPEELE
ncbi:MAG: hypothetical protein OXE41_10270 [Gammaproteobacteria bacterium]|nr:hypothetical protein [Gammaproteobacteria bacterium]